MFLSELNNIDRVIPSSINIGDDVVAFELKNNEILFKIIYKDDKVILCKDFNFDLISSIPKKKLSEVSEKMKIGLINYPEIKEKSFLFLYNYETIKIFYVSDNDDFINSLRIDTEFYSNLLNLPCVKSCSEFKYSPFKILAFTENIIIQKVYEDSTEK